MLERDNHTYVEANLSARGFLMDQTFRSNLLKVLKLTENNSDAKYKKITSKSNFRLDLSYI